MVSIVRAEAIITAKSQLSPGLAAASRELARFHARHARVATAATAASARMKVAYSDIADKVNAVQSAIARMDHRKGALAATAQIEGIRKSLAAADKIDAFRQASRRLDDLSVNLRSARQEAARAKAAMLAGGGSAAAGAQDRTAVAVDRATRAFREQGVATRAARAALADAGIAVKGLASAELQLKRNIDAATAALQKQAVAQTRSAARREGLGQIGAVAGVAAAYKGRQIAEKAVHSVGDFDIAIRKQRAFTDISKEDQDRLLVPQAKRIGQETQFTNLDIVKAQTAAMQGLPSTISGTLKAEVAQGMIENAKNYALVMESGMSTAAEAMRSYLQTTGQDISTKEKAVAASNKATNQLVRMAKLGGMNDEDVQQYLKFAAASGTAAGISPESLMSIAALARRGGLRGDEAGVFMRATSSKLVSPTKKGLAALNAAGIDHSQYVKMPGSLDVDALEGQFKTQMGLGFQPEVRERLSKVLSDPKIIGDRSSFVQAVTEAVEGQFPKTSKGTMRPADRVNVAKSAGTFHQMSATSVDAEGLLDRIMESSMTLAQLNAFLTDKHGGKGAITQRQREEYTAARKQLREAGDDPDFAKKKADEIMGGVGGSIEQAKGAMENFILSLGVANEGLIKFGAETFSSTLEMFEKLSTGGQQAATALGAIAALGAGGYGMAKLFGLLTGNGSSAALTGSAAALTESAVALNVAAARLGGAGIAAGAGTAAGAAGTAAAGGGAGAALAGAARVIPGLGTLAFAGYGLSVIGAANKKHFDGVEPGAEHNEGRNRRRAYHDQLRSRMQAFKANALGEEGSIPSVGQAGFSLSGISEIGSKAGEVKTSVEAIGPAATSAGSQISSGFGNAVSQIQSAISAVDLLQQKLNSLRMPSLSFGGSLGGLNTGKGMSEVR